MNESEETKEIKAFPSIFSYCKDSRPCPTVSQYQLHVHDTFAHPTGQCVDSMFGTPIRKFMLDLEVFFFFYLNSAKVLIQQ